MVITVGLMLFEGQHSTDWPLLMSVAMDEDDAMLENETRLTLDFKRHGIVDLLIPFEKKTIPIHDAYGPMGVENSIPWRMRK